MQTGLNRALIFHEDTNIRKRRTAVFMPDEKDKTVFYFGLSECGLEDEFTRAEGVDEAFNRAYQAQDSVKDDKPVPKWSGVAKVEGYEDTKLLIQDLEDLLYNSGYFRTTNKFDKSDMFYTVKLARMLHGEVKAFRNELFRVSSGLPGNELPTQFLDLAASAIVFLEELDKWKKADLSIASQKKKPSITLQS